MQVLGEAVGDGDDLGVGDGHQLFRPEVEDTPEQDGMPSGAPGQVPAAVPPVALFEAKAMPEANPNVALAPQGTICPRHG